MLYKPRSLQPKILEFEKFFKVILLLGARQVGKNTLLKHLFPHLKMVVFDPLQYLYGAGQDPDLFLRNFPSPLILDEVQYIPELLAALKRKVDLSEKKGQYLLTGSQNFQILKNKAESLAGRVGILQLHEFTYQELNDRGTQPCWVAHYLTDPVKFFANAAGKETQEESLTSYIWRGSLPGIFLFPDSLIQGYTNYQK